MRLYNMFLLNAYNMVKHELYFIILNNIVLDFYIYYSIIL